MAEPSGCHKDLRISAHQSTFRFGKKKQGQLCNALQTNFSQVPIMYLFFHVVNRESRLSVVASTPWIFLFGFQVHAKFQPSQPEV